MSLIKTEAEIAILREGGKRLATIMATLTAAVRPGLSGRELDALARQLIADHPGDRPSFLNYQPEGAPRPYPAALCVSINDAVVHGIPDDRRFQTGDLVGLDLGLEHRGLFTDMATTVSVGEPGPAARELLRATETALAAGIAAARPGGKIGDISAAIEQVARRRGLGVVRELGGHGVGHAVHEPPHIPNFGRAGRGEPLAAGMGLAIEPMFTLGSGTVKFGDDGYLVTTADGALAAHFEHTILLTATGPQILTAI